MADKRIVEDLSVEELERILAIKKREARQERLQRMKRAGRVIDTGDAPPKPKRPPINGQTPPNTNLTAGTVTLPPSSVTTGKVVPQFDDAVEDFEPPEKRKERNRAWSMFMNRSLLLVETAAVIGLVVLGAALFESIGTLESETAEAQRLAEEVRSAGIPTIEPTPQLSLAQVVLPTGHTPPSANSITQFNFDEVPAHLRGLVADQVYLPPDIQRPQLTDDTPLRVIIPKLNIDHSVVQGIDWDALKLGVGQVLNGATPSDPTGNVVLAAHNDVYGEIFRHLDQLEAGDQFQIQTQSQIYTYTISGWEVVEPTAVHVMDSRGTSTATLISCYPFQVDTHRIVVFADLTST